MPHIHVHAVSGGLGASTFCTALAADVRRATRRITQIVTYDQTVTSFVQGQSGRADPDHVIRPTAFDDLPRPDTSRAWYVHDYGTTWRDPGDGIPGEATSLGGLFVVLGSYRPAAQQAHQLLEYQLLDNLALDRDRVCRVMVNEGLTTTPHSTTWRCWRAGTYRTYREIAESDRPTLPDGYLASINSIASRFVSTLTQPTPPTF